MRLMSNMKRTLQQFDDFLKSILNKRFENIQELNKFIGNFLDFKISLELTPLEHNDFQLLANFWLGNEIKELYLDLYYLVDREQCLCLTNYDLDGEEALNENDLQIKITGVII